MHFKRYQVITVLLVIYALFMTFYFGLDLLKNGEATRFWLTVGGELLCIVLAFFALRRRDSFRNKNKD